jgi:hypothetical protein
MSFSRFAVLVALVTIAGCSHVAAVGGSDAGPDADADTDTETDTDTDADTDAETDTYEFTGEVSLISTVYDEDTSGGEEIALSAEFTNVDVGYGGPGYIGTFATPGGASCDIYYYSEMDDPVDPMPQIDAGEIRAGLYGGDDYMSVTFEDGAYTVDVCSDGDPENPIPDWAESEEEFFVDGLGSGLVPDFGQLAAFPLPGYFTSPLPGTGDLYVDGDGNYVISWDQFGEIGAAVVVASFNMDWDSAQFVCRPVSGDWSLDIPSAWIEAYTWGGGARLELRIVNGYEISTGGGLIAAEVMRVFSKDAYFNEFGED